MLYVTPKHKSAALLAWVVLFLYALPAFATDHDAQIWSTVNLNATLIDKISANLELQTRFTEDASVYGQRFIRPSLTYQLNEIFSLTAGYVHVLTNSSAGLSFGENRPWQQIGYRLFKTYKCTGLSGIKR